MDPITKKVNRKIQEEPQAEAAANPPTPGGREQLTNKCMISTMTSSLFFPKQGDQNA